MENDIFLQHFIFLKDGITPFKNMEMVQAHEFEELLSKGLKVGAIAKGARDDRHHLTAVLELSCGEKKKSSVKV